MSVRLSNPMNVAVWLAFCVPASFFGAWLDRSFGVAVFLLGCVTLLVMPSPWEARKPSALALKIFLLLELLYVVSFVYSAAFNGIQVGLGDFFAAPRYVFLGGTVVYLIRHYDAHVRDAMEWAMTAALYLALLLPSGEPQGYVAVMTLCYLLFFARLRLRFLHAATAVTVLLLKGSPPSWAAASLVLSAALAVRLYRVLSWQWRTRFAASLSAAVFVLLFAGFVAFIRAKAGAGALVPAPSATGHALLWIRRSPIFGWGPAEYEGLASGCGQYLLWLLNGGALGAGVIFGGLIYAGYRLLYAASGDSRRLAGTGAFLGSVALMLAAGPFLESFRLFFLTAVFMAAMHEVCP